MADQTRNPDHSNRPFPRYRWLNADVNCTNYIDKVSFLMQFWLSMFLFDILMREGNNIIIIESFVFISREHVLSKLKVSLWQIEMTLALYLPNQRNRTELAKGLLYTEIWAPARDGFQPIRIHDFSWSGYSGVALTFPRGKRHSWNFWVTDIWPLRGQPWAKSKNSRAIWGVPSRKRSKIAF